MALVLNLKPKEDFYVGDQQFVLWEVEWETSKALVRCRATGKMHKISDDMSAEIATNVFLSSGTNWEKHHSMVRLAFEAPREVLILRGEKYRNPPEHIRKKSAMSGFREITLSDAVKAKAVALGMTGDIADRLLRMGKRSAPHTHAKGNRRFDHYVLKIIDGVMVDIHDLTVEAG